MKRFTISAFCLISAFGIAAPRVDAQTTARSAQSSPHVAASRGIARGPINFGPRTVNAHPARMIGQPGMTLRSGFAPLLRSSNSTLAAMSVRQTARTYHAQTDNGMAAGTGVAPNMSSIAAAQRVFKTDNTEAIAGILARREPPRSDPATTNTQNGVRALQPISGDLASHQTLQSQVKPDRLGKNNHLSFSDALRSHRQEWHDCNWWRQHFTTIVFVCGGYYFLDDCYWYPAWGYDPLYNYYDYDGPIYTYSNLLPDETIANVQVALQQAGYYAGSITGSLDVQTRAALANYQRDQGLPVTGAIDQPTVQSLGLE
jgi:Putative peptidoglycan binding domain